MERKIDVIGLLIVLFLFFWIVIWANFFPYPLNWLVLMNITLVLVLIDLIKRRKK